MTDEQIHITALTEMFLGLGHEPTPERIAYYARLLKNVPAKYIRVACDHAVVKSKSGFAPSPGEIIEQAERIHRELVMKREIAAARAAYDAAVQAEQEEALRAHEIGALIDESLKN